MLQFLRHPQLDEVRHVEALTVPPLSGFSSIPVWFRQGFGSVCESPLLDVKSEDFGSVEWWRLWKTLSIEHH